MINQPPLWIAAVILLGTLLSVSWIDMRDFRAHNIILNELPNDNELPNNLANRLTLGLIAAGLFYNFTAATDFYRYLVGAVAGCALFWLLEIISQPTRKTEDPYRSNIKLLAAGGAWCGWGGLAFMMFIASTVWILWPIFSNMLSKQADKENTPLPYVPFLACACATVWTAQQIHA